MRAAKQRKTEADCLNRIVTTDKLSKHRGEQPIATRTILVRAVEMQPLVRSNHTREINLLGKVPIRLRGPRRAAMRTRPRMGVKVPYQYITIALWPATRWDCSVPRTI